MTPPIQNTGAQEPTQPPPPAKKEEENLPIPTPTPLDNENCSEAIKAHPLPFDQCSGPPPVTSPTQKKPVDIIPENRFTYLSLPIDLLVRVTPPQPGAFFGVGAIFRPIKNLGFGFQMQTNFTDEISWYGRVDTNFNLDRFGKHQGNIALLAGMYHYFEDERPVEEFNFSPRVDAQGFTGGLEVGYDYRFLNELTFSPFSRIMYEHPSVGSSDVLGDLTLKPGISFYLGLRACMDFFPNYK